MLATVRTHFALYYIIQVQFNQQIQTVCVFLSSKYSVFIEYLTKTPVCLSSKDINNGFNE